MLRRIEDEIRKRHKEAPFFLYDSHTLLSQLNSLLGISREASVYYAMKANPSVELLRQVLNHRAVAGIEIASVGEAQKVMQAGESNLKRVIYTGPGKTQADLEFVISRDIHTINVESLLEAHRINNICSAMQKRQDVLVRINTNLEMHGASTNLTSADKPGAFGIDEDQAEEKIEKIAQLSNLNVRGIHTYAATGILDHASLLTSVDYAIRLSNRIADEIKLTFDTLDFGGGFGIDYARDAVFNVNAYGEGLTKLRAASNMQSCNFVLELGRYIAADLGYFVTTIVDIKTSKGKKVVICDAGTNAHRRPYALKIDYPLEIIPMNIPNVFAEQEFVRDEDVLITGPLCTPVDQLSPNYHLIHARVGDLLVTRKAGAYGLSMSHINFLSNHKTKEFFI